MQDQNNTNKTKPTTADGVKKVLAVCVACMGDDDKTYLVLTADKVPLEIGTRACERAISRILKKGRRSKEVKNVMAALEDHAEQNGKKVRVKSLAAFDHTKPCLLVNLGGGSILRIEPGGLHEATNPVGDVLFVGERGFQPVMLDGIRERLEADAPPIALLRGVLLDRLPPPAPNGLTAEEQRALVLAFLLGIFLRDLAHARPVLALIGGPGVGKTVVARLLGLLLYGEGFDVAGVAAAGRAAKDLAAALVEHALVVRDDLNSAKPELMDLLARAATGARIELSTFHETLALSVFEPRAAVAITSFRPTWALREDILTRLLVLRLDKPPASALTQRQRGEDVLKHREHVWAELLMLLQVVVAASTEKPTIPSVSRFDDWEHAVRPALYTAGLGEAFDSALGKLPQEAVAIAGSADPMLGLIHAFASQPGVADNEYKAADLYTALVAFLSDDTPPAYAASGIAGSMLRNPRALAQFLSKLEREGSAVVNVTRRGGHGKTLLWQVKPK
jgi:hypothetical protein